MNRDLPPAPGHRSSRRALPPGRTAVAGLSALVLVLVLGLIAADEPVPPPPDPIAVNLERLRAMPLELRQELARRLRAFDALPSDQKTAIMALDTAVQTADPEVRARYQAVLRQYRLWLQTLPETDRESLAAADPAERFARVKQLLATYPLVDAQPVDRLIARGSVLNPARLADQAHWIRIWLAIEPAERAALNKAQPRDRIARLETLGRERGIADERPELRRRFQDKAAAALPKLARSPGFQRKLESLDPRKRAELLERLQEGWLLQDSKPLPVTPANLDRFARALPPWLRETLDALPPTAARERLTLLYRRVYPPGAEISERAGELAPEAAGKKAAPGARATPAPPVPPAPPSAGRTPASPF